MCVHVYMWKPEVNLVLGVLIGAWVKDCLQVHATLQWLHHLECISLSHQPLPVYISSGRDRALWTTLPAMSGCWWAQFCADHVPVIAAAVSSRVQWPWHSSQSTPSPSSSSSYILPTPSPRMFLVSWRQFTAEHSTVTYSNHVNQFWASAVTSAYCKKKLLWPKLTAALIYSSAL